MVFLSNLQLYVCNLQGLRTEALTILTLNRSVFVKLAAVCWQATGLKDGSLDNLDIKQGWFCQTCSCWLYVGYPQVIRTEVLTSNRGRFVKLAAVGWQPTGLTDGSLDNLDIKQGCFCETCSCMGNLQVVGTAVLTSNRGRFVKLAAVGWQPTGLKDGSPDNLDIKQERVCQTCSCLLATYRA